MYRFKLGQCFSERKGFGMEVTGGGEVGAVRRLSSMSDTESSGVTVVSVGVLFQERRIGNHSVTAQYAFSV